MHTAMQRLEISFAVLWCHVVGAQHLGPEPRQHASSGAALALFCRKVSRPEARKGIGAAEWAAGTVRTTAACAKCKHVQLRQASGHTEPIPASQEGKRV